MFRKKYQNRIGGMDWIPLGRIAHRRAGLASLFALSLHGAIQSYSETLLYSGFENLNLERLFIYLKWRPACDTSLPCVASPILPARDRSGPV